MATIIQFLESMGNRPLPPCEYEAAVRAGFADEASRTALLGRNRSQLDLLLNGRKDMCCLVVAADE